MQYSLQKRAQATSIDIVLQDPVQLGERVIGNTVCVNKAYICKIDSKYILLF